MKRMRKMKEEEHVEHMRQALLSELSRSEISDMEMLILRAQVRMLQWVLEMREWLKVEVAPHFGGL